MYSVWGNYNITTDEYDLQLSTGVLEDYLAQDYANWDLIQNGKC